MLAARGHSHAWGRIEQNSRPKFEIRGGATTLNSFYERPILNSPYRAPGLHHPLDQKGQPLEGEPTPGRRPSRFIVPLPASRKKPSAGQASLDLETYTENALINEIRGHVGPWRSLRNPPDWGVNPVSQRLLEHWRHHEFVGPRPFFCQIEYDDQGARFPRPRTLLIDSRQIEAGDALDKGFRDAAGPEIEQFKRELAAREGAGSVQGETSESALLREVMNTVGRPGRLGEQIRCVVSVSMLTEGWDTNTVTHILGVRAFGTQLLCEQVVGRGLRRQSYDLNPETGLFDVEYADIMGIPFDFASSPQVAKPTKPKPVTRVHAIKEREALEIVFPRVSGYRRDLPSEKLEAVFTEDSRLEITPADIGPTSVVMEGIVGAGVTITPQVLERLRPSEISFNLAKHLLYTSFRDEDGFPKQHLFPQIQRLARRWIDEGYLVTKGVPIGAILYQDQLARAAAKSRHRLHARRRGPHRGGARSLQSEGIDAARQLHHLEALLEDRRAAPHATSAMSCSTAAGRSSSPDARNHPRVLAYAKNQALGFEIPYLDGGITRRYLPDFLVRLDDGGDEPLNLVLEVKGIKDESDKAKAQTTRELWVPGVNASDGRRHGRGNRRRRRHHRHGDARHGDTRRNG